ncbi:hypothetical protein PI125_g23596 [Phytophthora idaei]|nr:hypothetical protein PI125_g23596 [Phytophthora idaei]
MDLSDAEDEEAELLAAEQRASIHRCYACGSTRELSRAQPGQAYAEPNLWLVAGKRRVNVPLMRVPSGTVDRWSSPRDAGGVAPIPLSKGQRLHGFELRVLRDTDSSLMTDGAVVPGCTDGDVTTPTSLVGLGRGGGGGDAGRL